MARGVGHFCWAEGQPRTVWCLGADNDCPGPDPPMSLSKTVSLALRRLHAPGTDQPVLTPVDLLIVAVSGGPDSLALLHLLARGGLHQPDSLIVAHINHGLRPTAAAEAAFVERIAGEWGVAFQSATIDVAALAVASGGSVEEVGRRTRYQFLNEVASAAGARLIAVGHNANDQAETVLMHFLRGAGLTGLRGMLPVAPVPGYGPPPPFLIRPLLDIAAADIRDYCHEHGLTPVMDESNQDPGYQRNRIRHELIPLLQAYNPRLQQQLNNMAAILADEETLIRSQIQEAWRRLSPSQAPGRLSFSRSAWRTLPPGLQRRLLRRATRQLLAPDPDSASREISFAAVEQARAVAAAGTAGASAMLPAGVRLTVGYNNLHLTVRGVSPPVQGPQMPGDIPLSLPVPGSVLLTDGWQLDADAVSDMSLTQITANPDPWTAYIAGEGITELIVRGRAPGERWQPMGMAGHSISLKDYMINRKVPAVLRRRWPLVAAGDALVWVVGHQLDERWRVTGKTRQIIRLQCWPLPTGGPAPGGHL